MSKSDDISLDDLKLEDLFAGIPEAPRVVTPAPDVPAWFAQARVFVLQRTICAACGAVYEAPGSRGLLVRFVNKRNMDIQEHTDGAPHEELPLVTRVLVARVTVCQVCAK